MSKPGAIRGMLERYLSPYARHEQGLPTSEPDPSNVLGDRNSKRLTLATTDAGSLVPHQDKLLVFRSLTGIDTVPALTNAGHSARTAPNIGIYTRVVQAERTAVRGYRMFSLLINIFLGTQMIVAAILTALGAADGPHAAVTAFGAINTIIAGAMTYLKASGYPNTFKYHENEWKVIREYIEQREREFCLVDCPLNVHEELRIIEDMYKRVKAELEANANGGNYGGSGDRARNPPPGAQPPVETSTAPLRQTEAVHSSPPPTSAPPTEKTL